MGEAEADDFFLSLEGLELRAGGDEVGLAISAGEGESGEALGDGLFLFGVDIFGVADVHGDDHSGVGEGEGLELSLAEEGGGVGIGAVVVGSDLDVVEGEVALVPLGTPVGDEVREEGAVLLGALDVRFALIPDDAAEGEGDEGVDHGIVEARGGAGLEGLGRALGAGVEVAVFLAKGGVGGEDLFKVGVFFSKEVGAGPGFGGGASPVAGDESDGDLEFAVELLAEEVGDGAELGGGAGGADRPVAGEVVLLAEGEDLGDVAEADLGEVCFFEVFFPVVFSEADHFPLHVGLAAADPDFPDEDVGEGEFFFTGFDVEGEGATGFWSGDFGEPFSGGVGGGGEGLAGPRRGEGDFLVRGGFSPDTGLAVLLEDHVALEDAGELEGGVFSMCAVSGEQEKGGEDEDFHALQGFGRCSFGKRK